MVVELKKGYTIESKYDKFTDSYITRLLDNESKQVGRALYSPDIVGRNYDLQSIKDHFVSYINNKTVDETETFEEPEEESTDLDLDLDLDSEEPIEESLDAEIKKKTRKTKKATRKAKLPALSKLSPIMPDQAKGISKFNAMQADGNSSMGSTTGSTSLGEEWLDRQTLINRLSDMGFKYNWEKYSDKSLYRIYHERQNYLNKWRKEKRERDRIKKNAKLLADQKKENSKDSYFRDGIEFESEDAAREYFGESMSRPYHWDVDEIERIILKAWEDADLRLRRDRIHISRHDNWCFVEIEYIDDWTFKHINKAWIKKTLKKELGLSEIKQSSWKNDGWGSSDYGKTLRYDMYVSDEQGMNESMETKVYLNDMHEAWNIDDNLFDEFGDDPESLRIERPEDGDWCVMSHDGNGTYYFGNDRQDCVDWCEERGERYYFCESYNAGPEDEVSIPTTTHSLNESFSSKNTKQFNTITEGLKFFENKHFDETGEDLELETMFEALKSKKKLTGDDIKKLGDFMNRAKSSDEVATYVKGLLSESADTTASELFSVSELTDKAEELLSIASNEGVWNTDIYDIDILGTTAIISILVKGDWKHDHARFDLIAREFFPDAEVYEYELDEDNDYDSDYYPSVHVIELNRDNKDESPIKLELMNESIDIDSEAVGHRVVSKFEDECRVQGLQVAIESSEINSEGYFEVVGSIPQGQEARPDEILDLLVNIFAQYGYDVDAYCDWGDSEVKFDVTTSERVA